MRDKLSRIQFEKQENVLGGGHSLHRTRTHARNYSVMVCIPGGS